MNNNHNYSFISNEYEYIFPQQISFIKIENSKVTICATTNKKLTSNCFFKNTNLNFIFIVSSPCKNIIRIQAFHHIGTFHNAPSFSINDNCVSMQTSETEDTITITSGTLSLEINKKQWLMRYLRNNTILSESQTEDFAQIKSLSQNHIPDCNLFTRQKITLKNDELIYGFGKSFNTLAKNGQTIEINNNTQTVDNTDENIPFYISNKGYGIFVNPPQSIHFDIGNKTFNKVEFITKGSYLDYFIINGPSTKDVLTRYNSLINKQPLYISDNLFKISMEFDSKDSIEHNLNCMDTLRLHNIPLTTINFNNIYNHFNWYDLLLDNNESYDFFSLINQIKDKNLKIRVSINPYISQHSMFFKECLDKGYFLKSIDGTILQFDITETGMALIDFTNPDAYNWFLNKLELLLDIGINSFDISTIYYIPDNAFFYNHSSHKNAKTLYIYLYNSCIHKISEKKTANKTLYLSYCDFTLQNTKEFYVHSICHNYDEIAKTIRNNISLSMSGFTFLTNVLNISEENVSNHILKRWAVFTLISPSITFGNNKTMFINNPDVLNVISYFSQHKARLIPYFNETAVKSSKTGIPLIRSMLMEFGNDKNCLHLDNQYMIGDNILVAPVLNDQNIAEYYLPAGIWTNYFTGQEYKGNTWIQEEHSFSSIPFMIRENSVIVTNNVKNNNSYNSDESYELCVYAIHNGIKLDVNVYDSEESIVLSATIKRNGHNIFITSNGNKPFKIRMVNMQAENCTNGFISIDKNDSIITPDSGSSIIEISF